ncbi:MAG TPA: OmpA family protein, partial [Dysgonamonadaceae bacterium]|nr:OmpA family protein [Dysgonamonadaceae bacterium]
VYLKNKGSDNWFMTLGGGANTFFGNGFSDGDYIDATSWVGQLSVGKWISPIFGARLAVDVSQHEHYTPNDYISSNSINPHVDVMWNATNALVGYRADRVYNFVPYVGVGGLIGMEKDFGGDTDLELTWNMGLINNFQLSNNFSIFVELAAALVKDNFGVRFTNNTDGDYSYDAIGQALVGIKFGLGGKQDFTSAELLDYNLINDLNSQINRLRAENENLSKRPEFCPECPEIVPQTVTESVYVPNVVFFRLNSATIDRQQQISVYNTAEYMKSNPNATVEIVAYADRQTGTPDYNMKLSERRAKAVADALTSQYNIDSSRINLDWKGDTEQPYAENDWNRVAIFIAD